MTDYEKILLAVAPNSKAAIRQGFAASMADCISRADLSNKMRLAMFLAQCAHESDGFRTTTEYASGKAYEGRKDLGNTTPGDGVRCKGRGIIQNTGAAAYRALSKVFGIDFYANPTKLAEFPWSALAAAWFWKSRSLNLSSDRGDIEAVTLRVNGGYNGLSSRKAYYARALHALSDLKGALIAGAAAETQKAVVKAKIGVAPSAVVAGAGVSLHPAAQSPVPSIVIVALVAAAVGCIVALVIAINRHKQTAAALTDAANGV
jgi:putative chitinase